MTESRQRSSRAAKSSSLKSFFFFSFPVLLQLALGRIQLVIHDFENPFLAWIGGGDGFRDWLTAEVFLALVE